MVNTFSRTSGWKSVNDAAVRPRNQHVTNLVAVGHAHLLDARIVSARGNVRTHHQLELVSQVAVGRRQRHRVEIVPRLERAQAHRRNARRAAGNTRRNLGRLQNLLRGQVVRVGVAGLLSRHHAHAAAHGDSLGRGLHQRLVHEQRRRGGVLEVEVRVLATLRQRRPQILREARLRQSKTFKKEAIGIGHIG